jgi:methylmalonyl-CoA mutase
VEEGVKEAFDKKADVVILCSSDEEYVEFAPQAYELLKDKAVLVVAGAPECMEELKSKGIQHFINVKSNVLETLKGFNAALVK